MLIRDADPDRDAAACAAIYEPFVTRSYISFEDVAPTAEELRLRIERVTERFPWLVAEDGGAVLGYAYACAHRERAAYRWAADVAVYIAEGSHRRGIGRALYGHLLELLARQGVQVACGGVTLPNDASVALHEACGFEPVGIYHRIGWKLGAWRDVGWWQLELAPADDGAPAELGPPPRLGKREV
jgi:phosphinothricin acetyltransferase